MTEVNSNPNPFATASTILSPRGVPLIVIPFMQKGPALFNWPARATTDPAQLAQWSNPKYKFNAGAVAQSDSFCFLDVDDLDILKEVEISKTLTVASRKGRHYYFRQTNATRKLGNRSLSGRFDFQQDRRQVVAPGSVHPTGYVYIVVDDSDIVPMPDALADWIATKSETQNPCAPSRESRDGLWVGGNSISKDEFESWLEVHGVPLNDAKRLQTRWMWIVGRCPWEELHTQKNGDRDFAVFLDDDRGPQIKCCHSSCGVGRGKHWRDYRVYLATKNGHDYLMKTGEKIDKEPFGLDLSAEALFNVGF